MYIDIKESFRKRKKILFLVILIYITSLIIKYFEV